MSRGSAYSRSMRSRALRSRTRSSRFTTSASHDPHRPGAWFWSGLCLTFACRMEALVPMRQWTTSRSSWRSSSSRRWPSTSPTDSTTPPTRWPPPSPPAPCKPKTAVLISGVLNIVGAFLSTEVAKTISGGIVDDTLVTSGDDLRGAGRGDPVEPADLAGRAAVQFLARPVRRADRRGVGRRGLQRRALRQGGREDPDPRGGLAGRGRRRRPDRHLPRLQDHRPRPARTRSPRASGSARSPPPRWSPSPTAPTTRRRPWASSR